MKEEKMVATYAELNEKLKNSNSFKFGTPITDEALSEAIGDKTCYCLFKDGRSEGHFTSVSDGCLMRAVFDYYDPFPTICHGRDCQFFEKRNGFWYRITEEEYMCLVEAYEEELSRIPQTEAERIALAIVEHYESNSTIILDTPIHIDRRLGVRSIDEESVEIDLEEDKALLSRITLHRLSGDSLIVEFSAADEETLCCFAFEFWQNVTETELGISGKLIVGYWWDNCFCMLKDREKAGELISNLIDEQ